MKKCELKINKKQKAINTKILLIAIILEFIIGKNLYEVFYGKI